MWAPLLVIFFPLVRAKSTPFDGVLKMMLRFSCMIIKSNIQKEGKVTAFTCMLIVEKMKNREKTEKNSNL